MADVISPKGASRSHHDASIDPPRIQEHGIEQGAGRPGTAFGSKLDVHCESGARVDAEGLGDCQRKATRGHRGLGGWQRACGSRVDTVHCERVDAGHCENGPRLDTVHCEVRRAEDEACANRTRGASKRERSLLTTYWSESTLSS